MENGYSGANAFGNPLEKGKNLYPTLPKMPGLSEVAAIHEVDAIASLLQRRLIA